MNGKSKVIKIGNRLIGDMQPLFIIAEVGVTCNYDMELSKKLIDVVKESGADAIKFIFWFPDELLSDRTATFTYDTPSGEKKTENMISMLSKLVFSLDQWREIKQYAAERDVILFSTINTPSGVTLARQLQLDAFKLSSWDYNCFPLWQELARERKPMLIDTGPVELLDVAKVMNIMHSAGNEDVVLLHCYKTTDYREINMKAIPYMRSAFGVLSGFSSTGQESDMDLLAVGLGACVLEKRLTISRSLPGHHQVLAKEPAEFKAYVKSMRNAHDALGVYALKPSPKDLSERKKSFRRIVANCDLPQGSVLSEKNLACKRPEEGGVSPEFFSLFLGRTLKRPVVENEAIQWEDLG